MAYSTHATQQTILDSIASNGGEGTFPMFTEALGPDWRSPDKQASLRKLVRRMAARVRVLQSPRRGVYTVHPAFAGFDARDRCVREIERFLTEQCGAAPTTDIYEEVAPGRVLEDRYSHHSYDHVRVAVALASSPDKFCQDYRQAVWNLLPEARQRLPLLGRWAAYELNLFGPAQFNAHCAKVGEAFTAARDARDLDAESVTAQRGIREALLAMSNKDSPGNVSEHLTEHRATVMRELREQGITDEAAIASACEAREADNLAMGYLLALEAGDPHVHRLATGKLVRGLAEFYRIDPVAATWEGKVAPIGVGEP